MSLILKIEECMSAITNKTALKTFTPSRSYGATEGGSHASGEADVVRETAKRTSWSAKQWLGNIGTKLKIKGVANFKKSEECTPATTHKTALKTFTPSHSYGATERSRRCRPVSILVWRRHEPRR